MLMNSSAPIADEVSLHDTVASNLSRGNAQDETDHHTNLVQGANTKDLADDAPALAVAPTPSTPGFRYFTCFDFQDSS